jgi:hypothetical protein
VGLVLYAGEIPRQKVSLETETDHYLKFRTERNDQENEYLAGNHAIDKGKGLFDSVHSVNRASRGRALQQIAPPEFSGLSFVSKIRMFLDPDNFRNLGLAMNENPQTVVLGNSIYEPATPPRFSEPAHPA